MLPVLYLTSELLGTSDPAVESVSHKGPLLSSPKKYSKKHPHKYMPIKIPLYFKVKRNLKAQSYEQAKATVGK